MNLDKPAMAVDETPLILTSDDVEVLKMAILESAPLVHVCLTRLLTSPTEPKAIQALQDFTLDAISRVLAYLPSPFAKVLPPGPPQFRFEVLSRIKPGTTPGLLLLHLVGVDYVAPLHPHKSLQPTFDRAYQGDTPAIFLSTLDRYERLLNNKSQCGRIIPILQSSGTGKSRLLKELSREVPLISICLRESDDETTRDKAIDESLRKSEYYGEEMTVFFLAALFRCFYEGFFSRPNLVEHAHDYFYGDQARENRNLFFSKVCRLAQEDIDRERGTLRTLRATKIRGSMGWYQDLHTMFCKQAQDCLSTKLAQLGHDKMLIAIDGYSSLDRPAHTRKRERGMTLNAFLRFLSAQSQNQSQVSYWYPIVDTDPSAGNLFLYPSQGYWLLPPFVHLPFDVSIPGEPPSTPIEALHIDHLVKFGRASFCSAATGRIALSQATKKLFGRIFPQGLLKTVDETISAWSPRILLDLSYTPTTRHLATEGVERGLRWLVSIDRDRAETMVPSEPAISIAAMFALTNMDHPSKSLSEIYRDSVDRLLCLLEDEPGILVKGRAGELESRLLLTMARDAHCPGQLVDSRVDVVNVHDFLTTLLGDDLGINREESSLGLKARFANETKDGYINFTHFVRMDDSMDSLPTGVLKEAWSRGVAFQCHTSEEMMDLLVVSYAGFLEQEWDDTKLGYIVVRAKAGRHAPTKDLFSNSIGPRITFPDAPTKPRQPITPIIILMDLRTGAHFKEGNGLLVNLEHTPVVRPQRYVDRRYYMDTEAEERARWAFHVRGCGPRTYPLLEHIDYAKFERLLGGCHSDDLGLRAAVLNKFPNNAFR